MPTFIAVLKDEDASVRQHAAEGIQKLCPEAKAATPLLADMLNAPDFSTRFAAALVRGHRELHESHRIRPAIRAGLLLLMLIEAYLFRKSRSSVNHKLTL